MTEDQLIEDVFDREGRVYQEPPKIDQPTSPGGITLKTLSEYCEHACTVDDLRKLDLVQAHEIVRWKLRQLAQRNGIDRIVDPEVRLQLLDFAYNSGPALAVRWLQRVVRVPRTGKMDAATTQQANAADPWLLHHALIMARLLMIDLSTDSGAISKTFEEGLENRALKFSRLAIP